MKRRIPFVIIFGLEVMGRALYASAQTATSGIEAAAAIQAALAGGKVPDLTEVMATATAAGISVDSTATAQAVALADLKLLSEVASIQQNTLDESSSDWSNAVTSGVLDLRGFSEVYDQASLAGVPSTELEAALTLVKKSISGQVSIAYAKVESGSLTAATMTILARAIDASRRLELDSEVQREGKEVYAAAMEKIATESDLNLLEVAVEQAAVARVEVPATWRSWAHVHDSIQDKLTSDISAPTELRPLLALMGQAASTEMPSCATMEKAEVLARNTAASILDEVFERMPKMPTTEYMKDLLEALELSKAAGADDYVAGSAIQQRQAVAERYLENVLDSFPDDYVQLQRAFEIAEIADVENLTDFKEDYAMSLYERVSFAQENTSSLEGLQELSLAIMLVQKLVPNGPVLKAARAAFTEALQGPFTAADLPFVQEAIKLATAARAQIPASIARWPDLIEQIDKFVAQDASNDAKTLFDITKVLKEADEKGLPLTEALSSLKIRAKSAAISLLEGALEQEKSTSLHDMLPHMTGPINLALATGAFETASANLKTSMQTLASRVLEKHLAGHCNDGGSLNQAFALAEKLNVTGVAAKRTAFQTKVATELSQAKAAVDKGATSLNIEELGRALYVAHKMTAVSSDVLKAARKSYETALTGTFGASDMPFLESAWAHAGNARVTVPAQVKSWMEALDGVRTALKLKDEDSVKLQRLTKALEQCTKVGLPDTAEISKARAKAKTLASDAVSQASEESTPIVTQAVAAAVGAGLSESDILSGQAVLSSSESSSSSTSSK